ncbi:hypothetical protein BC831DRAFT_452214 [Entophlyctis helioformis]|nr:hypothetical protein BC831DRAFT_452214 [Entophlyctis helioformis]
MPLLQYALIKTKPVPQAVAIVLPILIGLAIPLVLTTDSWLVFGYCGAQHLINALRLLDTGFVDRAMSSRWSLVDYYEYFLTFETKETRRLGEVAKAKKLEEYEAKLAVYEKDLAEFARHSNGRKPRAPAPPKKSPSDNAVPVDKRDATYYSVIGMRVFFMWVLYNAVVWYMTYLPVDTNPPIRSFTKFEVKAFADQAILSLNFYLLLNIVYMVLFHVLVEIFAVPYQPIMNSPYLAVGFRDFWSFRWNFIVKESLHRGVFVPTMAFLRRNAKGGNTAHFRMPAWHPIVGALSSFFISALIHEWVIMVLCETPSYGEHFCFFIIQALYTIGEVLVRQIGGRVLGYDPITALPKWIGVPLTWIIMNINGAFFMAPLMREGILSKILLPNLIA